jgi:hypothetical protein
MDASNVSYARMWAAVAERNGASTTLTGATLDLFFPTRQAKDEFESLLNLTVQTLGRRPGRA